jgi:Ca-activated chloride channel family protein
VSEVHLLRIEMLYLLWVIPALGLMLLYGARRRREELARFAPLELARSANSTVNRARRRWKAFLALAGFAFAVFALARPAWNPVIEETPQRGRDVVFLLDVSRSMLAEDLAPNRLERAKLAILDALEKVRGDRVALVVFAGTAVVKCPLTHDYGFFRMAVEEASPESVSRGGTAIGDAIRVTIEQVLDREARSHRDVILITDGEDHGSFPVEAARRLGELGVRLIAVGLGDEERGRRIPITGPDGSKSFLKYDGQEVWTRLDAETLRRMANATPGGRYLHVATGAIDFGEVYVKLMAGAGETELGATRRRRWEEQFQIFLMIAFALWYADLLLPERKTAQRL